MSYPDVNFLRTPIALSNKPLFSVSLARIPLIISLKVSFYELRIC